MYAKTLFKPTRPKEVDKIIRSYTRKKVPFFFKYAKSAKYGDSDELSDVEDIGTGIMDRITKCITSNKLMFKSIKNLAKVDYRKLLDPSWEDYTNEELNSLFSYYNRTYGYNIRYDEDDKNKNNINFLLQDIRNELIKLEPDENKLITSIVIYMYGRVTAQKKKLLWLLYGKQLYENLERNHVNDKEICLKCGRRVDYKLIGHKCRMCRNEENRQGFKKIICIDCEKEFIMPNASRAIRCPECREKHIKEYDRQRKRADKIDIPQA